jgi:hypothetical protein
MFVKAAGNEQKLDGHATLLPAAVQSADRLLCDGIGPIGLNDAGVACGL